MAPIRLAIVGCGKVTERFHLPVCYLSREVELAALIERDRARAEALAKTFGVPRVFDDPGELGASVDAAIVAVPHHLHADIASALLAQGVHVLVEKPMALSTAECDRMIAASTGRAVLAVGLVRRFYQASRFVKEVLEDGLLGEVTAFDVREGAVFNWQVASDATFRKEMGGGVLADIGAHVLDLLLWWLGDYRDVSYRDDAMGGVEADCELELRLQSGAYGTVELSRTRQLRNSVRIVAERGTLEIGPGFDPEVTLRFSGRARGLSGVVIPPQRQRDSSLEAVFARQLSDFVAAIRQGREPFVPGAEGRRAIALIEACRRVRQPLVFPWLSPDKAEAPRKVEA